MENDGFKFSDYDCIGFDLDNTLARYNINTTVEMEYNVLSEFMIKKGYSEKHLLQPIDYDFFLKGLILDVSKGNILKVGSDGKILMASHGTRALSRDEIEKYYPNSHWEITDLFVKEPLATWNGPHSEQMRSLQDYFDIVVSLVFARVVDSIDEVQGEVSSSYSVYSDILEGLYDMFKPEQFELNRGGYFQEMKKYPDKYYHKCSDELINWLKQLKSQGKLLFLITGSYINFASLTASNTLGQNWKDYFDIVITFAKKPGFFNLNRDFIGLEGFKEIGPVSFDKLELGKAYGYGNWNDLYKLFKTHCPAPNPKFVYVGDSLIQDVYTPSVYSHCDTVAVVEELETWGDRNCNHPDRRILYSKFWGSYFQHKDSDTIWYKIIKDHAKTCIPNLESVVKDI